MSRASLTDRAAALRRAFDEGFASPAVEAEPTEDFLAIRLAGDPFALRVAHVARIAAAPTIVSFPSRSRAMLGVASVRGSLVAVHSLPMLLGYDAPAAPGWIVLVAGADALGLGIDRLEGFIRHPRGAERVLALGGTTYSIVDMPAVVESIMTGEAGPKGSHP